jgi:hypothetical protein
MSCRINLYAITRAICILWLLVLPSASSNAETSVSYLVLAQTVEPLMIVRDGDPMAGGLFTEILKKVFEDSEYIIEPTVMPWQRMKEEFRRRDNWVTYGFREGFEADIPFELDSIPIFPFNHVAATMTDNNLTIEKPEDLFGKTVILVENFHYPGLDSYLTNPAEGTGSGQIQSVRAFSPEGTMQMLKHRRGDVVFDWQARLVYNLSAASLKPGDIRFQDASSIIPTKSMYFAYSPQWSASFKQFVHTRLQTLRADGTIVAILRKYGGATDLMQ